MPMETPDGSWIGSPPPVGRRAILSISNSENNTEKTTEAYR